MKGMKRKGISVPESASRRKVRDGKEVVSVICSRSMGKEGHQSFGFLVLVW